MSLVRLSLLGRWKTPCGRRGGKWSQHVTTRCLDEGTVVQSAQSALRPLGDASSYRAICLLDTMGKLLEEMILQRLKGHMVRENGLSEYQFGFRKGRSTVDAIQAVVDIATKARRGTGKRKGFCALISIDITMR